MNLHLNRSSLFLGLASEKVRLLVSYYRVFDVAYVLIVFTLDWVYFETVHPYERQFTINDLTISHPFAEHERVPGDVLVSRSLLIPPIVIVLVTLLLTPAKFKLYIIYISCLTYYVAMFTTVMVTDVLKNWIGRCRPDFLARCKPIKSALPDVLYYAKEVCSTYDPKGPEWGKLVDGFRTTPSGHSSMAFTMGAFLTLFMLAQFNAFNPKFGIWRIIIASSPLYYSFYVALSRTQDYRHHFVDVILGSLLGSLITWATYRRFWPRVSSKLSYVPETLLENVNESETDHLNDEDGDWYETHLGERSHLLPSQASDLENQGNPSSFQ